MEQLIFYSVIVPLDRIDTTFCFSTCMWEPIEMHSAVLHQSFVISCGNKY